MFHHISFEDDTLEWTNTIIDKIEEEFTELVVTKEVEESPSLFLKDIRVLFKLDLLTKEPYVDPYYQNVIHDHSKLLIKKLICQI